MLIPAMHAYKLFYNEKVNAKVNKRQMRRNRFVLRYAQQYLLTSGLAGPVLAGPLFIKVKAKFYFAKS